MYHSTNTVRQSHGPTEVLRGPQSVQCTHTTHQPQSQIQGHKYCGHGSSTWLVQKELEPKMATGIIAKYSVHTQHTTITNIAIMAPWLVQKELAP